MQTIRHLIPLFLLCITIASCHNKQAQDAEPADSLYSEEQIDSLTFLHNHHYTRNYNFVVTADSLALLKTLPANIIVPIEPDTVVIRKNENIVVADIDITESNNKDSVWIRVARDQDTFGWTTESELLASVVPDDPISQFIVFFSNTHLLAFVFIISIVTLLYISRITFRHKTKRVHFDDFASFYPTLLSLIVAAAATFYSSIQLFAPDKWQHFYFHPTLNPFSLPPILAIFLCSVWALIIVGIAVIDDAFHKLSASDALLYTGGLSAVCAAFYIIFSVATLYYIGYPLLFIYAFFAIRHHYKHGRFLFKCGNCGANMHKKGRCPKCGTVNE